MSEEAKHKKPFPPRWATLTMVAAMVTGVILGGLWLWQGQQDIRTAQANSRTLAEEIKRVCATNGTLRIDDRDLCAKATQVQADPTKPLPGPKGSKGDKGDPGDDGAVGSTGAKGDAGSAGKAGSAGTKGVDGLTGAAGDDGKDGAQGLPGTAGEAGPKGDTGAVGPQGPAGKDGADGAAGAAVQSFTFTDATGATYTCTPNPPGSQTYTCAAQGAPEPTGGP